MEKYFCISALSDTFFVEEKTAIIDLRSDSFVLCEANQIRKQFDDSFPEVHLESLEAQALLEKVCYRYEDLFMHCFVCLLVFGPNYISTEMVMP